MAASWSEVSNQYQRRAERMPSLLGVVQGSAVHEKSVLIRVAAARARVGLLLVTPVRFRLPLFRRKSTSRNPARWSLGVGDYGGGVTGNPETKGRQILPLTSLERVAAGADVTR